MKLETKPARGNLCFSRVGFGPRGTGRVDEQCGGGRGGHQFVQKLQLLRQHLYVQRGHAGNISARSAEASDQSELDWVISYLEDDGDGRSRRLGSERRRLTGKCNHAHLTTNQTGGQSG